ncbi:MAG: 2-phospho-L-lactate transferase [Pseudomonadota bacterium]
MTDRVLLLSGGVGGAKVALGLNAILPKGNLSVIANTADDFTHLGLRISPDIDTLLYTLSGLSDQQKGWGRKDETWTFMKVLSELGEPDWFNLGDGDLAMHVTRSMWRSRGLSPTEITKRLAQAMGVTANIIPMSNDDVETFVLTSDGLLSFQAYFVKEQCTPRVSGFEFSGILNAKPNSEISTALREGIDAILIAPSNPYVSVDPILSIPGMLPMLRSAGAPIIAISPIVGGNAIKGPSAKMMREMGVPVSAKTVALKYSGLIDGFVLDNKDEHLSEEISNLGLEVLAMQTIMNNMADKEAVAIASIDFAKSLRRGKQR